MAWRHAVLVLGVVALAVSWPVDGTRTDGHAYARAVEQISTPVSLYYPLPPPGPHDFSFSYLYPPFYASLLALVPIDPLRTNIALVLAGIVLLFWGLARVASGAVALRLFVPLSPWVLMSAAFASITPFTYGLAAMALGLPTFWAASLLGIATGIKVTPIWALAVLLVRERAWKGTVAAAVFGFGVCLLALEPSGFADEMAVWMAHVAPTLAQGQFIVSGVWVSGLSGEWLSWLVGGNISPTFAPLYWLVTDHSAPLPTWASAYLTITSIAAPLAAIWFTRKMESRKQVAWVLAFAVLCSPIFRPLYLPFLAPAVAFVARTRQPS